MNIRKKIIFAVFVVIPLIGHCKDVVWFSGGHVSYAVQKSCAPVVDKALEMFETDMRAVTGKRARRTDKSTIEIYQLDLASNKEMSTIDKYGVPYYKFITKRDAFWIGVRKGKIIIVGSNGRGTAYGILELSRLAGVSPWIYWGDVRPERKKLLAMDRQYETLQSPSVEYRGISISNDDWSNRVWAGRTSAGNRPTGAKGTDYYRRLFSLMLRLRANAFWPDMRGGEPAFIKIKGNKELADSFAINVGLVNYDPFTRNGGGQRKRSKRETPPPTARKSNKNTTEMPRAMLLCKDALERFESDADIAKDACPVWTDDCYGYLTRLPDKIQRQRKSGTGVFYHLSYCGAPHDYLWLTTTQPGLLCNEMRLAYDHDVRKMWIANVHDPKVAAYHLSLFMDMAWNIDKVNPGNMQKHLQDWLMEQFGRDPGRLLTNPMTNFYRLCGIRRPEFMGWNRVDLDSDKDKRDRSGVQDTEFNAEEFGNELERYLADYDEVKRAVDRVEQQIRPELKDAFFAAVKYPVYAASAMATKHLQAQEARHIGKPSSFHNDREALESAVRSWNAYTEIKNLTEHYNKKMAGGKWNGNMNMAPRGLSVFGEPSLPGTLTTSEIQKYSPASPISSKMESGDCVVRNACDYNEAGVGAYGIEMLGRSMKAVALPKEQSLVYRFYAKAGNANLYVALIPTHAVDKGDIRYSISIDGGIPKEWSLKAKTASRKCKDNVLRGQVLHREKISLSAGMHTLEIKALDAHVVVDQWMIDYDRSRKFYMFPVAPAL